MSNMLPIGSGMHRAKRNRSRGPREGKKTLAECPFCGIAAPGNNTIALDFKLLPELPDDEITVLLLMREGEPELAMHSDGRWFTADSSRMIEGEALAWAHVPCELPGRVRQLTTPLRKQSVMGGGVH